MNERRLVEARTACDIYAQGRAAQVDGNGNVAAQDGVDRCACGCKYWEHDRCIDCGEGVEHAV